MKWISAVHVFIIVLFFSILLLFACVHIWLFTPSLLKLSNQWHRINYELSTMSFPSKQVPAFGNIELLNWSWSNQCNHKTYLHPIVILWCQIHNHVSSYFSWGTIKSTNFWENNCYISKKYIYTTKNNTTNYCIQLSLQPPTPPPHHHLLIVHSTPSHRKYERWCFRIYIKHVLFSLKLINTNWQRWIRLITTNLCFK